MTAKKRNYSHTGTVLLQQRVPQVISHDLVISCLLRFHYLLVIPFLPLLEGAETMDFEELSNLPQF